MHLDKLWESLASYNSPQLTVVLVIIAMLATAMLLRHLLASGTDKLADSASARSEALEVLERMVERADRKTREQDARIRALEETRVEDARYDQSYRHALSNKTQAYMAWGSIMHELLMQIRQRWTTMPDEWKTDIDHLSTVDEIDERYPMPQRK